jgi:hypothetical protein
MAYLFHGTDLSTYGITPGHAPGGNIAMQGCFDMPARIGKTMHEWGDENGCEPYVETAELFFGGRDISFTGYIFDTRENIYSNLLAFQAEINSLTELETFDTPYGAFVVYIKSIQTSVVMGACNLTITMREPGIDLSTGTLPSTGSSAYTIDSIPIESFGLYIAPIQSILDLPETKQQYFNNSEVEGFQVTKRQTGKQPFEFLIIGSSIADFQAKIKALYLLFSSAGTRTLILNSQLTLTCFAPEGFKVSNVIVTDTFVLGKLKINLYVTEVE